MNKDNGRMEMNMQKEKGEEKEKGQKVKEVSL